MTHETQMCLLAIRTPFEVLRLPHSGTVVTPFGSHGSLRLLEGQEKAWRSTKAVNFTDCPQGTDMAYRLLNADITKPPMKDNQENRITYGIYKKTKHHGRPKSQTQYFPQDLH
jgi:hypothetical protein